MQPEKSLPIENQEVGDGGPEDLDRVIVAFQPDAVELEHQAFPGGARWTLYTVLALILAIIIWASLAKVDRVVTARGELITTEAKLVVQPWATGIVREVHVGVGDQVKKGDLLVTLDSTFAQADLNEVEQRVATLRSRLRRMEAEASGTTYTPASDENAVEARTEADIFERRRHEYQSRVLQFDKKLDVTKAALTTAEHQRTQLSKRLKLVQEIESLHGKLLKQSNTSKVQYLEAKDSRLSVETEVFELTDRIREFGREQDSQLAEKQTFQASWSKELAESMAETRSELASLQQRLDKATQLSELVVLKAPASGIVLEVAELSIGSVAKEAEPLITLVPVGGDIEAQVNVPASDIGRILNGDAAVLKLDAFPFQRHGTIEANVRTISEDAFNNNQPGQAAVNEGAAFYRAHLSLSSNRSLREVPETTRLIPGMTLSAEIKIGSRRVITYLIYPVIKALGESLREP